MKKGYFEEDSIKMQIKDLRKVKKIRFSFDEINMCFLCVDVGDYLFLYKDIECYTDLLKLIAGKSDKVGIELRKYEKDFGIVHELWKQLLDVTFKKFSINRYSYIHECGLTATSDYIERPYGSWIPRRVNSIDEIYDKLVSLLPENIGETTKKYQEIEAKRILKEFTDICGNDLEMKDKYIVKLESDNENDVVCWNKSINYLEEVRIKLQSFSGKNIFDSVYAYKIELFFDYCLNYMNERVRKLNEKELINHYGPVDSLKKSLRDCINRLGFVELLDLFKEYKEQERYLCSKARCEGEGIEDIVYKQYIDVYRLGSILISDKLNKLNRNKAKTKYISQDLLDEAMVFYYETSSVQDAYAARFDERYSQNKESGDIGEQKVEYALKWLDASFIKIEKKSRNRLGNKCIYISNSVFIDEKQEYDHLLVSSEGIFNIETKNYSGKLIVDGNGNWIRKKNDTEEGIKNPLQQIRQHEKMLQSFLPSGCRIISILCIANDKVIIEGIENCSIPIVKSDMLVEFLENWKCADSKMTDIQKKQCVEAIYPHMI